MDYAEPPTIFVSTQTPNNDFLVKYMCPAELSSFHGPGLDDWILRVLLGCIYAMESESSLDPYIESEIHVGIQRITIYDPSDPGPVYEIWAHFTTSLACMTFAVRYAAIVDTMIVEYTPSEILAKYTSTEALITLTRARMNFLDDIFIIIISI